MAASKEIISIPPGGGVEAFPLSARARSGPDTGVPTLSLTPATFQGPITCSRRVLPRPPRGIVHTRRPTPPRPIRRCHPWPALRDTPAPRSFCTPDNVPPGPAPPSPPSHGPPVPLLGDWPPPAPPAFASPPPVFVPGLPVPSHPSANGSPALPFPPATPPLPPRARVVEHEAEGGGGGIGRGM
jgi:hypothetical protein